jgi:hypothetical protein
MRKVFLMLCIAFALVGCNRSPITTTAIPPETPTDIPPTKSMVTPTIVTPSTAIPLTERPYQPSSDGFTHIHVDGYDEDWEGYPAIYEDARGDQKGDPDLITVFAIKNDTYLFLMLVYEGEIPVNANVQLKFNLETDYVFDMTLLSPDYSSFFSDHPGHVPDGKIDFLYAQEDVLEFGFPLEVFLGSAPETIQMTFQSRQSDNQLSLLDESEPAILLAVPEEQPDLLDEMDLLARDSVFCQETSLRRKTSWLEADGVVVQTGYLAEYFIPSTGLNVPSDLVVLPDGDSLVTSSWQRKLLRVSPSGDVEPYNDAPGTYALDQDASGILYGYNSPVGGVYRFLSQGGYVTIHESDLIQTFNESPLAVTEEGVVYVAPNKFFEPGRSDEAYIVEFKDGAVRRLEASYTNGMVLALDVRLGGTLYATIGNSLYSVDRESGELTEVARLPSSGVFHGLEVSADGTAYVSTVHRKDWTGVYKVSSQGEVSLLGEIEGPPIEGIALGSDGSVLGVQRNTGALLRFKADGEVEAVVVGNDLITPETMVFTPCGEFLVVLEEGGTVGAFAPDGGMIAGFPALVYGAPHYLSMSPEGWFTVNLGMPPMEELWFDIVLPNGQHETLSDDIDMRGAVILPDRTILASAMREGKILQIQTDGTRMVLAEDLDRPRSLVLSRDGTLYFVSGDNQIAALTEEREVTRIASPYDSVRMIGMGPDGNIYAILPREILRITPQGVSEVFLSGVSDPAGLAFDVSGNLYVSAPRDNSIVRVSGFASYSLSGEIVDQETGEPVEGMKIRVAQTTYPYAGTVIQSGADGAFHVQIVSGEYELGLWMEGYQFTTLEGVLVDENLDLGKIEASQASQ